MLSISAGTARHQPQAGLDHHHLDKRGSVRRDFGR
jgi:hypothetical protein